MNKKKPSKSSEDKGGQKCLNRRFAQLKVLPESIQLPVGLGHLTSLRTLYLDNLDLSTLPSTFWALS
jgi:hypothetical protein